MATTEDVKKLAALARLSLTDKELETFTKEFDAILAYVGQLETLQTESEKLELPPLRNVMRKDEAAHAPRAYTEALAEQFPERQGDALVVKQIISHD